MIRGIHGLFFSSRPNQTRAFLRDKLNLPFTELQEGWFVFAVPVAEVDVHPREKGKEHAAGMHDVSFLCDDLSGTVAELRSRGVRFDDAIQEQSYGFTIHFRMPGGIRVQLWEPKYASRATRRARTARPRRRPPGTRTGDAASRKRNPAEREEPR